MPARIPLPVAVAPFVLALVAACAGPSAANDVGTTTVTSAPVPASELTNAEQIRRLEVARDRALLRADTAESLLAAQRERNDKILAAVAERSNFEDAIWSQLDRIDARVKALRAELPKAGVERRTRIDRGLEAIAVGRAKVDDEMRRINGVPAVAWEAFKHDVQRDVNALSRQTEQLLPPRR